MYGTSAWPPTSAAVEHPSAGASPPRVFSRWTKVVFARVVPPVGPACEPIDCSSRHGIEPAFGQLGSEPAGIVFPCRTAAHTLLLSRELCHVALPNGSGLGAASFGFASGLKKCVMI